MRKTIVYVDGFNLYYGLLRGTRYKWLDLLALFRQLLTQNDIVAVKYFTARVKARATDVDAPSRQNAYLRALATSSLVSIYFGQFLSHAVRLPEAKEDGTLTGNFRWVVKTEEKGSDVNIASHMIADAYDGLFDAAVLVTGDSDLVGPVRMVRTRCQKTVGVLNPQKQDSRELKTAASFYKQIRPSVLARCQLPSLMRDAVGLIHKPRAW